jgi:hypothetical protein
MIDVGRAGVAEVARGLATSRHPRPVVRGFLASPRIRVVGAPVSRAFAGDPSIGATENSPRGDGPAAVWAGTRAVFVSSSPTKGTRRKTVSVSRGMLVTQCGRREWNAAPGQCRRKGFACDHRVQMGTGVLRRESLVPGWPSAETEFTMMSHWLRERHGAHPGVLSNSRRREVGAGA